MAKIYYRNSEGKKVTVEVSEEVYKTYRQSLQEEWRIDKYEEYNAPISINEIVDAGFDFADTSLSPEDNLIANEDLKKRQNDLQKLTIALEQLNAEQKELIRKVFFEGITKEQIAKENGVSHQAINDRMKRIFSKLKKIIDEK